MQHLEGSGTPVLYMGRTVLKLMNVPYTRRYDGRYGSSRSSRRLCTGTLNSIKQCHQIWSISEAWGGVVSNIYYNMRYGLYQKM
jgi:hypothetical protein